MNRQTDTQWGEHSPDKFPDNSRHSSWPCEVLLASCRYRQRHKQRDRVSHKQRQTQTELCLCLSLFVVNSVSLCLCLCLCLYTLAQTTPAFQRLSSSAYGALQICLWYDRIWQETYRGSHRQRHWDTSRYTQTGSDCVTTIFYHFQRVSSSATAFLPRDFLGDTPSSSFTFTYVTYTHKYRQTDKQTSSSSS